MRKPAVNGTVFLLLLVVSQLSRPETTSGASDIRADERVVFFPTAARLSDDGRTWLATIHGWIFEPERDALSRQALTLALRKALSLDPKEPATKIFEQRMAAFLVDNERGRKVSIRVGAETVPLPASRPDGHFQGLVTIPVATARQLATDGLLRFRTAADGKHERTFSGEIHLLAPDGVSVISDIDDTVKISNVLDRKKLLQNTFYQPFRPVAGMPALYRRWAASGARFHFVSNSPWQLFEPLQDFARAEQFPAATFDLRPFRWKDPGTLVDFWKDAGEAKLAAIQRLLQDFPRRRFVLVGDSGERDPETYGTIARKFPKRIVRIYIRDVTGESADAVRYQRAFAELESEAWQVFQDPAGLHLPRPEVAIPAQP